MLEIIRKISKLQSVSRIFLFLIVTISHEKRNIHSNPLRISFKRETPEMETRMKRIYSAARGRFFFGAEFLNFLEYFSIYVSHDLNFFTVGQNYVRATFFVPWSCPYLLQKIFQEDLKQSFRQKTHFFQTFEEKILTLQKLKK